MKQILIGLMLSLCSTIAFAEVSSADLGEFNNLTAAQKAEVLTLMAQKKEINTIKAKTVLPEIKTSAQVQEWVDVGKSIGVGLAAVGNELGIAADKLAGTTIGQVAIIALVVHFFGEATWHIMLGIVWFIVFLPMWFRYFNRMCLIKDVTTTTTGGTDTTKATTKTVTTYDKEATDMKALFLVMLVIGIAFGFFVLM